MFVVATYILAPFPVVIFGQVNDCALFAIYQNLLNCLRQKRAQEKAAWGCGLGLPLGGSS